MKFSFSRLSTYLTCPRQYEFQYVQAISPGISIGKNFGSSVHNTLKRFGEAEIAARSKQQLALFCEAAEDPRQLLTASLLRNLWDESFIVKGYRSQKDSDSARKKGAAILKHFYAWWEKEQRDVQAVEKRFRFRMVNGPSTRVLRRAGPSPITLFGRFDRVERADAGIRIIDFKTCTSRQQEEVDRDLQLSIYALACQEKRQPGPELLLLFLREDGITEVKTQRSEHQLQEAREQILLLSTGIIDRAFAPSPSTSACGGCPYTKICDVAV